MAGEELTEAALNHKIGASMSQAYNRNDLLDARRKMMEAYSSYVTGAHQEACQSERACVKRGEKPLHGAVGLVHGGLAKEATDHATRGLKSGKLVPIEILCRKKVD